LEKHELILKSPSLKKEINDLKNSIQRLVSICTTAREEQKRINDQKVVAANSLREQIVKADVVSLKCVCSGPYSYVDYPTPHNTFIFHLFTHLYRNNYERSQRGDTRDN
jgi:hypothetical protein